MHPRDQSTITFAKSSGLGEETCYSTPIDFDAPYTGFQTALCIYIINPAIANLNGPRSKGNDSVRGGQKENSKTLSISLLINNVMNGLS